jgi:hypothetical protein
VDKSVPRRSADGARVAGHRWEVLALVELGPVTLEALPDGIFAVAGQGGGGLAVALQEQHSRPAGQARALMRLVGGPIQTGMQEPSKSLPHVGSRLFAAYAAASLVPVVLLGAMLVRGSQREALESGLEQGRAQAAVIEEMAIAPALTGADLDHQLTAAERQRLQDATDLAIFNGSVIRLRLRGFKGRVVFSDNGSTAGALPTSHHAFRAAAVGRTDVAIVQDPDGASGQVIRVLQPVVAKATGQATGVLELYLPYSTIAEHVQAQMRRTFWRLAVGLAALYAVLAFIAWSPQIPGWTRRSAGPRLRGCRQS